MVNKKAFSLVELLTALSFSVFLVTGVIAFYNVAGKSYSSGATAQNLQNGASIVLTKIIEGAAESGTVYRLSTSTATFIPNVNTLFFCQVSPCSAAILPSRSYALDATNTKILYFHPTLNPLGYDVIYTAPTGSSFFNSATNSKTLRFFSVPGLSNVIEIDVALTQNVSPGMLNSRVVSGSASTYILLRNHP